MMPGSQNLCCKNINALHSVLLFYSGTRWLLFREFLQRVYIGIILKEENKLDCDNLFGIKFRYFMDTFEKLKL